MHMHALPIRDYSSGMDAASSIQLDTEEEAKEEDKSFPAQSEHAFGGLHP